jgi:phosphonatase-like hydrolase
MSIELVVFDMAGTTVRDDDAVHHCLGRALAAGGIHTTRDEINAVMGLPKPMAIRAILERDRSRRGNPDEMTPAIHEDFLRRMMDHYWRSPEVAPMPYTLGVFEALRDAGIQVALDTGFSRPIVAVILRRLGWDQGRLLSATVASDEVARGRPHPDMIRRAMELTGVTASAAVAKVGDTPADLAEGTAARCGLVVGVTNGSHTREQLAAHPHTHLVAHLGELLPLVLPAARHESRRAATTSTAL